MGKRAAERISSRTERDFIIEADDADIVALLASDAAVLAQRYRKSGAAALLPASFAAASVRPKSRAVDSRFLGNIVRQTDSYNAALRMQDSRKDRSKGADWRRQVDHAECKAHSRQSRRRSVSPSSRSAAPRRAGNDDEQISSSTRRGRHSRGEDQAERHSAGDCARQTSRRRRGTSPDTNDRWRCGAGYL